MDAAAWTGSDFVLVGGQELGDRSFEWRSADGLRWERTELNLATSASSSVRPADVAISGPQMVMVGVEQATVAGTFDQAMAGTESRVWESTDGRTWQGIPPVPLFAHALADQATFGPAGLLVLASKPDPSNPSPLWLATR